MTATDPAFVLGAVLLPGAPDLLEPALAALASRPAIDLRGDPDDPHAIPDLLRLLGAAPTPLAPGAVAGCPYRGLAAFGEDDAALFVGRERETADAAREAAGGSLPRGPGRLGQRQELAGPGGPPAGPARRGPAGPPSAR